MATKDLTGQASSMAAGMDPALAGALSNLARVINSSVGGGGVTHSGIPTPRPGVVGSGAQLGGPFDYTQQYGLTESWNKSMANALLIYSKDAKKRMRDMTAEQRHEFLMEQRKMMNATERDMGSFMGNAWKMMTQMSRKELAEVQKYMYAQFKQAVTEGIIEPITHYGKLIFSTPFKVLGAPIKFLKAIKDKVIGPIFGFFKKMWSENLAPYGQFAKDAWGLALDILKKVQKFLEENIVGFLFNKAMEIKKIFESIPGADVALRDYRAVEEAMVRTRQQYGATIEQSREYMNVIYSLSNGVISVQQNIDAMSAALARGLRGEQLAEYTEDIALWSQAIGESVDNVADLMYTLRVRMNLTRDDANAAFASVDRFVQAMAVSGGPATSVGDITTLLQANEATARLMNLSAESYLQTVMVTSQLATASGASATDLTSFIMKAGTDQSLLLNMVADPAAVQRMIQDGRIDEVWRMVIDQWNVVSASAGTEDNRLFLEALVSAGVDLSPETLDLIARQYENLSGWSAEAADALTAEGDAIEYRNGQAAQQLTAMQAWNNEMAALANNITFGGISLGEALDMLDQFSQRIQAVKAGFDLIGSSIDLVFGPLGLLIKPIATLVGLIVSIGGATIEMSDEVREAMGPFASFFDLSRGMGDMFQEKILPFLRAVWDGVVKFFTEPSGINGDTRTMFQILLDNGIDWMRSHGMTLVDQMVDVIEMIADALVEAFEIIENSEMGDMLGEALGKALGAVGRIVKITVDMVSPILLGMFRMLADALEQPDVVGGIHDFLEALGGALSTAGETFKAFFDSVLPLLIASLRTLFATLRLSLPDSPITDMFLGTKTAAVQYLVESGQESLIPASELDRLERYRGADFLRERGLAGGGDEGSIPYMTPEVYDRYMNQQMGVTNPISSTGPQPDIGGVFGGGGVPRLNTEAISGGTTTGYPQFWNQATMGTAHREHAGIDLYGDYGTPVNSLIHGEVYSVVMGGEGNDAGNQVFLYDPESKLYYQYAHLADVAVRGGQAVNVGDMIGTVGVSGNAAGVTGLEDDANPHLHLVVGREFTDDGRLVGLNPEYYMSGVSALEGYERPVFEDQSSLYAGMPSTDFASGGLVMSELLARVGEAGPEVIAPLPELAEVARVQEEKQRELINTIREEAARIVLALMSVKDTVSDTSKANVVDLIMGGGM